MELALLEDGHRMWGFVIYRCACDSNDAAWTRLLQALRRYARETLAYYRGLELLDYLRLNVVEDKDEFDGASTSAVRDHFRDWASAPDTVARERGAVEVKPGLSQRYRYCIRVNAGALDRVSTATAHTEERGEGSDGDLGEEGDECFVDLIWKDWEPLVPHPREKPTEAVEGCT